MRSPVFLVIKRDGPFSSFLRDGGCQVLNLELIKTEPAEDLSELNNRLARIEEYDGLFFTSPVAAEIFVRQSTAVGRKFAGKVYVLGQRAKSLLERSGFDVVFRSSANTADDLIGSFDNLEFAGKNLLFIRGDKSLRTIPRLLTPTARIEEVVVYRTLEDQPEDIPLDAIREQLRSGGIDWICFFSPSGVESFDNQIGFGSTTNAAIAVIGKTTAQSVRARGLAVSYIGPKASAEEFAKNLMKHIKTID